MAKGLSAAKAKKILTDGYVKGKPLTAKQRKYFGAIASGATPLKAINGGWLDKYQDGGSVPKAQTGVSTPIELDEVILKSVRKSPEWKAYRDSLNYYNKGEKFIKEGGAYDYLRERYKDPLKKDKYEKARNQKLEDEITEYGKRDYDYYKKGSAKRNVIQRDEHYGGRYEDGLHLFQDVYSAEDWSEPVVPLSDKIQPIEVLWGPESGPRPIYKKPTKPMDSYSSQLDSDGIEPYTQDLESLISGNIEAQPITQHKPYNQSDKKVSLGLLQKMGIENPESQGFHYIKDNNGNFKTMQTREAYRKDNLRPNNTPYPPKAQNGIKEAINKYLGDPQGEAREFAENPDELANIDNMRHAQATRLTQEAIANKTGNIPLVSDALGLLGSNALGIGHELTTLFGDKDKRDWLTKLQESGEDVLNNLFGSVVGALPMDNKTKDDVIKYASYNNMLPDGYVRGEQGEEDGLSENVYFKNEDGEVKRPEYKNGGWLDKYEDGGEVPKAQNGNFGGVNTDIRDTSGEPIYDIVNPDDPNYDAKYKETYEGGAFASMPNQLDEVVLNSGVDYEKYPLYDDLSEQDRQYFKDEGSIGRGVRRRAQTKRGLAEDALAIPGQLLQGALETAQAPQAAMVEGIEALRGNDYNFSNALPGSGTQRLPSQAFGFEDKPGWDLGGSVNTAMDIVADPTNLVGVGLYDDIVKLGLKATPKLNSIAKTFGKYSDALIDRTKNISKFNTAKTTPVDINAPWWETAGFNKPDVEMNNIFSRILDKLPKKVRETYASRVKGIKKASDLPRLDSSEFDILKNIDEIMTLREMGGSRQIMLERALKSNLDDPILESIFYKNKKQLQSELDDLTSTIPKPKKVVGTLDSTEEGVEQAIENVNRYGVVQLNPDISGFSLNRPSTSSRPSVDIDTMVRNIYDDVDNVDNVVTGNVATKKSQINQAVTEIPNRVRQSKPAPKNSAIDVEGLSGQDLANISSYPYVKPGGYTEELVPLVKLGPHTSKRDYANMVKDARAKVRMSTRGDIFTGSTDTSYQSYLPQLNEVFSPKMKGVADPIFLGYKPMNPMGNINRAAGSNSRSVTRGINENIAAYLNNQIDTNISKIKLPDDLLRPFFQNSSGEVMLPQYGLRKLKKGGVIKDDMGQWAHPGEVTEISGNTMATHGYGDNPLYVVPDVGEPRMVQANTGTQTFPGATKFTEYPMAQQGAGVNKEGVEQYKWFKDYMQSPKYVERLQKEFPNYNKDQIGKEVKSRLENVMQTRVGFLPRSSNISTGVGGTQGVYNADEYPGAIMLRPEYSENHPAKSLFKPGNYLSGYTTIPLHEWSHAADDGGNRIPQSTTDLMLSKMKENSLGLPKDKYYYTKPTEYLGRMQPLRYLMQKEGLYNAGTQDFTKEDLEKAKQNKTIKNNVHFQNLMENVNSDEGFIELMNKVASVNQKDNSKTLMAKQGKSLVELNQLTNFTNYNTPQPGGWLDKYN